MILIRKAWQLRYQRGRQTSCERRQGSGQQGRETEVVNGNGLVRNEMAVHDNR